MTDLKQISAERVSRFSELATIDAQSNNDIPLDVCDIIYSRKLRPVIGAEGDVDTPFNGEAPIKGAGGMTILYAQCPPGTGPSLHNHRQTYETFTVMQGRFEFMLGAHGKEAVTLGLFDTISVPPGYYRAFKNISDEEGILQVIITGGVHDMNDIYFPKKTRDEIVAKGPQYLDYFQRANMCFSTTE